LGHNTQLRTCISLVIFSCFRNTTDTIISKNKTKMPIFTIIILFEGLSFQNTLLRNYYALLFLLVPGQANQEKLLGQQVLCTSRTSRAWQFHSPEMVFKSLNMLLLTSSTCNILLFIFFYSTTACSFQRITWYCILRPL
jgi:hypothetical protein